MMQHLKNGLGFICLFILLGSFAHAQSLKQMSDQFSKGKYTELKNAVEKKIKSGHKLTENETVLYLKTLNRLADYDVVISNNLSEPASSVANKQEYQSEKAYAYIQKGQFKTAATILLGAYQLNPTTGDFIFQSLTNLWQSKLSWIEIYELLDSDITISELKIKLTISNLTNEDEVQQFSNWLDKQKKLTTQQVSLYKNQAEESLTQYSEKNIKIGLLLPIGKNAEMNEKFKAGRNVLYGFLTALESVGIQGSGSVSILVRDTEGDTFKAFQEARELLDKEKVKLIIGPIFSNECYRVVKLAEQYKTPIISPTASDDELSQTSSYFFQMNPSFQTRGRLAAEEALKLTTLVKDTVLIVAEDKSDSFVMGESFASVMKDSGIAVIDRATYTYGSEDIRRFLPYTQKDTTQIKDLIYAPIEDDDQIDIIVPQLSYLKVFGQYVGNSLWDNRLKLRNYKTILNGMLICKDSHIDSSRLDVRSFVRNYQTKYYDKPENISYRGFDSFLLTKYVIENQLLGFPDSDNKIKNMPPIVGLQSVINFKGKTMNQYLTYLRFINNEIIPVTSDLLNNAASNK